MYPRVDKIETGKRIRSLMKVRGLKPTDVQDKLSLCCVQTVYKWMRGGKYSVYRYFVFFVRLVTC